MFRWLTITIALLYGFAGCGESSVVEQLPAAPDQLGAVDGKQVVARVGGVPLLVDDLQAQRAGQPEKTPSEALQELITFELLAQEAHRRALHQHPDVRRVQKRALANLFVRREHGETFTKQTIPRELVEQAYALNKNRYQRPEMVGIAVLFARLRDGDSEEKRRASRQLMDRALSLARAKPPSAELLSELRAALAADAKDKGVALDFARINTARMRGPGQPITDAAFAMKPKTLWRNVIATPRGYHIVYLGAKYPAVDKPLSEVEGEIRERIFEDARKLVFQQLLDGLWKRHRVEIFPDALQQTQKPDQAQRP